MQHISAIKLKTITVMNTKRVTHNRMQRDECENLRDSINSKDDAALSSYIKCEWERFDDTKIKSDKESTIVLSLIKSRINKFINREKMAAKRSHNLNIYRKIGNIAAVFILPALLFSTYYFYTETQVLETNNMIVSTGRGEFANITLPDGTKVALSSRSELSYAPHLYNKKDRFINFEGEAFFDVQKDSERKFIIETEDSHVIVLGTKFNFRARSSHRAISLFLKEGKVDFISRLTGKSNILTTNHKAELLKHTGEVTITELNVCKSVSWEKREMSFANAPFSEVINTISELYDVDISYDTNIKTLSDSFTGTLPSNDILETIEILEHSYKIKALNTRGGEIQFKKASDNKQ